MAELAHTSRDVSPMKQVYPADVTVSLQCLALELSLIAAGI